MTALMVRGTQMSLLDDWMLVAMAVVMLPIVAYWIVECYQACTAKVRRLFAGLFVAAVLGGLLPLFYIQCYWWMVECWF